MLDFKDSEILLRGEETEEELLCRDVLTVAIVEKLKGIEFRHEILSLHWTARELRGTHREQIDQIIAEVRATIFEKVGKLIK